MARPINQGYRPKELVILGQSGNLSKGTGTEECGDFQSYIEEVVFVEGHEERVEVW